MNTHTCTQIYHLHTSTVHEICVGGGLHDRDAKGKQKKRRSLQEEEGDEAMETHHKTQEQ